MKKNKSILILSILLALLMAYTITWASLNEHIAKVPEPVLKNPWFITSIVDVYSGLLLFYCWILYKEKSVFSRLIWLTLLFGLGNFASALYVGIQALKSETFKSLLLNQDNEKV